MFDRTFWRTPGVDPYPFKHLHWSWQIYLGWMTKVWTSNSTLSWGFHWFANIRSHFVTQRRSAGWEPAGDVNYVKYPGS